MYKKVHFSARKIASLNVSLPFLIFYWLILISWDKMVEWTSPTLWQNFFFNKPQLCNSKKLFILYFYSNIFVHMLYFCFYSLDAKSWMFTDDAEWPGQPRSCRGRQKNKLDCELPSSDHDPGGNADSLSNHFWLIINLFIRRRLGHCFLPSERLRVASWSETKSLDRV